MQIQNEPQKITGKGMVKKLIAADEDEPYCCVIREAIEVAKPETMLRPFFAYTLSAFVPLPLVLINIYYNNGGLLYRKNHK